MKISVSLTLSVAVWVWKILLRKGTYDENLWMFVCFYQCWKQLSVVPMRKMCRYSQFFWSTFSRIRDKFPYSVKIWENKDQKNSEYGHFTQCLFITYISTAIGHPFLYTFRKLETSRRFPSAVI